MALSPSETNRLLQSINHSPKKKLGQNFLIDGNIVHKSLRMAENQEIREVIEIGPGLGTLSRALLEQGFTVHAVEIDKNLSEFLKHDLHSWIEQKAFRLTEGDAVKHPLGSLSQDTEEFMIIANLPYAISSAWMEAMLATQQLPKRMVLMLQKEAVDRLWAKLGTKAFHALGIFLRSSFSQTDTHRVPRQCFHPQPIVDSILVRMDRLSEPFLFSKEARDLIRRLFTQRRKQIGSLAKKESEEIREKMFQWLTNENICSSSRPEQIDVSSWQSLALQIR